MVLRQELLVLESLSSRETYHEQLQPVYVSFGNKDLK
jgi:hypothetical protein